MRPHRKACIVNCLMEDHQSMTAERANAIDGILVADLAEVIGLKVVLRRRIQFSRPD